MKDSTEMEIYEENKLLNPEKGIKKEKPVHNKGKMILNVARKICNYTFAFEKKFPLNFVEIISDFDIMGRFFRIACLPGTPLYVESGSTRKSCMIAIHSLMTQTMKFLKKR